LYRLLPDAEAASHGYLRVIDESGEDYGYSADRFFLIEVPSALEKALPVRSLKPQISRTKARLRGPAA
jgi:hypothetical protein